MKITWDPDKAIANAIRHGIRFSEAATVLADESAITREDLDAVGEQRFATLGRSDEDRTLVVIYAYRGPDRIRIISAWKANRRQRMQYEARRC